MKVVIIGAGNIGLRHAQSLVVAGNVDVLSIVDPVRGALKKAAKFLSPIDSQVPVNYYSTLNKNGNHDVAIIATSAGPRYKAIQSIKDRCKYLIIEKFLFNKEEDYEIDLSKNVAYVNCPRSVMPCFDQFKGSSPTLYYYGVEGLLSNTIHFADLLAHLTGDDDIKYNMELTKKKKTKRKGYFDSEGRVLITSGKGLAFLHTKRLHKEDIDFIINDNMILEEERKITDLSGQTKEFDFKLQSELTAGYIDAIRKTGKYDLTQYETSKRWHLLFIEELRKKGWKHNIT